MSNSAKLSTRKSVRAASIRREPPATQRKLEPPSREREILLGIIGVTLFALAIAFLTVGFSAITGHEPPPAPPRNAAAPTAAG